MTTTPPLIVGAGFTGLLAAHAWPTAPVIDAMPQPAQTHKALMRFRTGAVSHLTGIEFRKVQVRKGIWHLDKFIEPNIQVANLYAQKVIGRVVDRSIWNLDTVTRFIAPENFYEQLLEAVRPRVQFNTPYDPTTIAHHARIINTAPLWVMLEHHRIPEELFNMVQCHRSPIRVTRYRVPNADVFQTVYLPDPELTIYRMSITKDLLIIEEVDRGWSNGETQPEYFAERAFGIRGEKLQFLDQTDQSYGKVNELDARLRQQVLLQLTTNHHVYSLGRFATWRNVLLDDVVHDINVIKRLIKQGTGYDAHKLAAH